MKTILVLTGGSETDSAVFATALAAARPLSAHLEFLHIHVSPGQAVPYTPHIEFARGAASQRAMERLAGEAEARSAAAVQHFREFCRQEAIEIAATYTLAGRLGDVARGGGRCRRAHHAARPAQRPRRPRPLVARQRPAGRPHRASAARLRAPGARGAAATAADADRKRRWQPASWAPLCRFSRGAGES